MALWSGAAFGIKCYPGFLAQKFHTVNTGMSVSQSRQPQDEEWEEEEEDNKITRNLKVSVTKHPK